MFPSKLDRVNKNNNSQYSIYIKFFITLVTIGLLNLIINSIIRYYNFFSIFSLRNQYPFGIRIDIVYVSILVVLSTLFIFTFKIIKKYPIACALILVGAWSNLIERAVFGYVVDYINIKWGYINFADICLWSGLLLINYQVWFNDPMEERHSKETHDSVIKKMQKPNNKGIPEVRETKIDKSLETKANTLTNSSNNLVLKKGNRTMFNKLDIPKDLAKKEEVIEELKKEEEITTKPKKQVVRSITNLK